MTTEVGEEEIRVVVSKGHQSVEMMIPSGFPRESLTEDLALSLLQQSGVEITDKVTRSVKEMITNPPPAGEDQRALLAEAMSATRGEDAYIKWFVTDPAEQQADEEQASESDSEEDVVSFYDRSAYIVVKNGDVIGQVVEPTEGEDGRDVLGQAIAAISGKGVVLKMDESVLRDSADKLIAQCDGVLHRDSESICIRQMIEVPEYVDFSTGNIDFTGNVVVRQGVRDCFVVEATGSVEVKGLIEAATIKCGTDLFAHGGMAGRERGYITVGRNLVGKYLDNIQGQIKGDLEIQREVINCELTIHGSIQSPRGTIIGGRTIVTGAVEVVALGSGAGVATELVLGSVPGLDPFLSQLERLIEQLTKKQEKLEAEQQLMKKKNARMLTAADKERQTEITFEHEMAITKIGEATLAQAALVERIKQYSLVDLTVHRKLFHGVILTVGNQSFNVRNEVRGPITVKMDGNGNVVYRQGDASGPMSKIADIKAATA